MSGAAVAAVSGIGYGVFQSFNRRAVGGMRSIYLGTFLQLVIALAVLVLASAAAGQLPLLARATTAGILWFLAAGFVHFFCGWTFLNASQARIGAARTSPLLSTTPVFGAVIAALTLGQLPDGLGWLGIVLVVGGALAVSLAALDRAGVAAGWRNSLFGLGAGLAWSISPILIDKGLTGLDSPLAGVTIGLALAVAVYAAVLPFTEGDPAAALRALGSRDALFFKLAGGLVVGLATWGRYAALENASVALVLGLSLLSVPTVLLLAPLLMGRAVERVTAVVWCGAALVIGGSLLLGLHGA